jgi:hypothetical protein
MLVRLPTSSIALRTTAVLAVLMSVSGCGNSARSGSRRDAGVIAGASAKPMSCAATVLTVLGRVAMRIYRQGLSGERTAVARRVILASAGLRDAVERGDRRAARSAAQALVAGGHMTNLRVMRGSELLADVGGPAVAPLRGTLTGVNGLPIGSYVTSVWSDSGLLAETNGVTKGMLALLENGRSVGGSFGPLPAKLEPEGTVRLKGRAFQYVSLPFEAYPAGALGAYLLKPADATAGLCGASSEDTVVHTLSRIADRIYAGERGPRTRSQVLRVQRDAALLKAVSAHDPLATKAAVQGLLTQHIVRLRVSSGPGEQLLADVGGPYVLAPVRAPLLAGGRRIGSVVLSIQDDEGYLRLTKRLVGVRVLMYMDPAHPQLVKNSLGPAPGAVPASGSYTYRGKRFRVYTVKATAFPSGPLTIRVLIPIPYA